MKKIIYILIVVNFFIACKSNSEPNINNSASGSNSGSSESNNGNSGGNDEEIIKSWKIVGDGNIYSGNTRALSLTISDSGIPYIAYEDQSSGANIIGTVKKLDGNNWEKVGVNGFSIFRNISDISIEISKMDIPYVTYINSDHNKASLYTISRNVWIESIRESVFGDVRSVSLALSSSGDPYIAYKRLDDSPIAGKYANSAWTAFEKISDSESDFGPSICLSRDNIPYVAYIEHDITGTAKYYIMVKKYIDLKWETVGTEKFADTVDSSKINISLAMYNNTPYVAYVDNNNNYKATVMSYDGASWKPVGRTGFSRSGIEDISLQISESGVLYVSYRESNMPSKITVVRFNGTHWELVGKESFSNGKALYISLSLSKNGIPYVAYYDNMEHKIIVMKFE